MTASILQSIPVFAGVGEAALELLGSLSEKETFKAGDILVREGEPGNRMYLLAEGEVEVVKHLGTERETVLARLHGRDFFGEMCLIECVARSASVRALTDGFVLGLRARALSKLFHKAPEEYAVVILNIARDMSRRLRALDEAYCSTRAKA